MAGIQHAASAFCIRLYKGKKNLEVLANNATVILRVNKFWIYIYKSLPVIYIYIYNWQSAGYGRMPSWSDSTTESNKENFAVKMKRGN
jgi:hypothetical protein